MSYVVGQRVRVCGDLEVRRPLLRVPTTSKIISGRLGTVMKVALMGVFSNVTVSLDDGLGTVALFLDSVTPLSPLEQLAHEA